MELLNVPRPPEAHSTAPHVPCAMRPLDLPKDFQKRPQFRSLLSTLPSSCTLLPTHNRGTQGKPGIGVKPEIQHPAVTSRFYPGFCPELPFFWVLVPGSNPGFSLGDFFWEWPKGGTKGVLLPDRFFSPFPGFRPTRNQTQFPGGFQPRFRIPVSNPGSDPDRADPGFGSPFAGNPEVPKTRRGVGENNL